jgi:hypothetical protein
MTARMFFPVTPDPQPDGGEAGKATRRPVGITAELDAAEKANSRRCAARHLLEAMSLGLPLADATRALADWDAANEGQGGAA